jgi:microcystin-dependent protein
MEFYLSQIILFAGNYAPVGWLPCAGQILPIEQNVALFSLIGTQYGGDGTTTFGLPKLPPPAGAVEGFGPGYMICVEGVFPPRP